MINNSSIIKFKYSFPRENLLLLTFTDFPISKRGESVLFKGTKGFNIASEIRPEICVEEKTIYGPGEEYRFDEDICYFYGKDAKEILDLITETIKEYNTIEVSKQ